MRKSNRFSVVGLPKTHHSHRNHTKWHLANRSNPTVCRIMMLSKWCGNQLIFQPNYLLYGVSANINTWGGGGNVSVNGLQIRWSGQFWCMHIHSRICERVLCLDRYSRGLHTETKKCQRIFGERVCFGQIGADLELLIFFSQFISVLLYIIFFISPVFFFLNACFSARRSFFGHVTSEWTVKYRILLISWI